MVKTMCVGKSHRPNPQESFHPDAGDDFLSLGTTTFWAAELLDWIITCYVKLCY